MALIFNKPWLFLKNLLKHRPSEFDGNLQIFCSIHSSPFGNIYILATEEKIVSLGWGEHYRNEINRLAKTNIWQMNWEIKNEVSEEAKTQIALYFAHKLKSFDLPLLLKGTTFQLKVWKNLMKIPYGETWSYQNLARECGNPLAVRAVGRANGQNPIPIIIPCHRVIQKNGLLGGYSGGIEIKDFLLKHEGVIF